MTKKHYELNQIDVYKDDEFGWCYDVYDYNNDTITRYVTNQNKLTGIELFVFNHSLETDFEKYNCSKINYLGKVKQ